MRRVILLGIAASLVVAPALALSVGSEDDTSSINLTEVRTVADPIGSRLRAWRWRR